MSYALSTAFTFLNVLTFTLLYDAFFERKRSGPTFWVSLLLATVILLTLLSLVPLRIDAVQMLLELLFFLLLCRFLYRGRLASHIFVTLTAYAAFFAFATCLRLLFLNVLDQDVAAFLRNRPVYGFYMTFSNMFTLLLAALLKHFHRPREDRSLPWPMQAAVLLFPVLTLALLLFFFWTLPPDEPLFAFGMLFFSFAFLTDVLLLAFVDQLQQNMLEREKAQVAHERGRMQEQGLQALSNAYTAQRKLTHDFKKHLAVLAELLAEHHAEEAYAYLKQVQEWQTERILWVNSHNPTLDAILNQKAYLAQQRGIDMRFELNDLSGVRIKAVDLAIVLGNLLDNAIEACEKMPGKGLPWVQVKVVYTPQSDGQPGNLFFSAQNPSAPIRIVNDTIATTKSEPWLHGFGLPCALDTLKKYHAEFVMRYADGTFLFATEWPDRAL